MTTANGTATLPLFSQHLADLRRSGLNDEQIKVCGFQTVSDPKRIGDLLRWKYPAKDLGPCWLIPFLDRNGGLTGYSRVKPDRPRKDKNKPELD